MPQEILESNDERETEPALPGLVDNFEQVDRTSGFLHRLGDDVARAVDGKISTAPAVDIIGRDRGINIPLRSRH